MAITLSVSEPEPDIVVVRESPDGYTTRHPGTADFGFIVEVSNTSLDSDGDGKIPIYARDNMPVHWIVNLIDRQIEVYEQPSGTSPSPTYGSRRTFKPGDVVPVMLGESASVPFPSSICFPERWGDHTRSLAGSNCHGGDS